MTQHTGLDGPRAELQRELLRWRDVVAGLYCAPGADSLAHRAAFRALLQLRPDAAKQIRYLLPGSHAGKSE